MEGHHLEEGVVCLRHGDNRLDDLMPFYHLFLHLFLFGVLIAADLDFTSLVPIGPFDFGRRDISEGLEDDSL